MKLLIIPSWYPTQIHPADGSFFKDRAHILKNAGFDVTIFSSIQHSFKDIKYYNQIKPFSFYQDNNLPTFISEIINIYPKMEKFSFERYQMQSIKILKKVFQKIDKPDLVLFNSSLWSASMLSTLLIRKNIPYIISEHLKEFLLVNKFSSFQKSCINNSYSNASKIIATSSSLKNSIEKKFPKSKNKLLVIPNPVNEDYFSLKPKSKDKSHFTITCIALFRSEKNINILLESFNQIIIKGINASLKIIGDGPCHSNIKKQINKLKIHSHVKLLGYLSQTAIVKELHSTDLLVLSSKVETFGMVLIEAQTCGVPVVATDCGGPKDIVNRNSGLLVEPDSIFALTEGILTIIKNINQYSRKKIREETICKFGKKQYINSMKNLFNEII